MTVSSYVVAAYAVFALALGWDYFAPRLRLRRARRAIVARAQREGARKAMP